MGMEEQFQGWVLNLGMVVCTCKAVFSVWGFQIKGRQTRYQQRPLQLLLALPHGPECL